MARFTLETNPNPPHSPPGTNRGGVACNVFKLLRETHEPPISLTELAKATNLSKSTIQRTEQGLYPEPPTKLLNFYVASPHFIRHRSQYASLIQSYKAFQRRTRVSNGPSIAPFFSHYPNWGARPSSNHPLTFLLAGETPRSRMEFCKAFCVPPDSVNRWINRPDLVAKTPNVIESALKVAGYDDVFLYELNLQYLSFRKASSNGK